MRSLITIAALCLLIACSSGSDTTEYVEVDRGAENYVMLSSGSAKGPCDRDAKVLAFPLYFDTLLQTGSHFLGGTKTNTGYWEVPAQISETYTEAQLEGLCMDELTGNSTNQSIRAVFKTGSEHREINALTTIAVDPIRKLLKDNPGLTADEAVAQGEALVASVFGFSDMRGFSSISLDDGDLDAARLAVASAAILKARTNPSAFMVEISEAIKAGGTLAIESELSAAIATLPIATIHRNLKERYEANGVAWNYPPMHTVAGFGEYYGDLLTRTPTVLAAANLDDTESCSFDQSTFNMFAIPHVFTSAVSIAKYIALNFTGNVSIWTRAAHVGGYDAPGVKVADFETLREVLIDTPETMAYNGLIGDIKPDASTDYYIVVTRAKGFALSTGCDGGFLPFGRKLASNDGGATWIGHDNNTTWFRMSGVRYILYE